MKAYHKNHKNELTKQEINKSISHHHLHHSYIHIFRICFILGIGSKQLRNLHCFLTVMAMTQSDDHDEDHHDRHDYCSAITEATEPDPLKRLLYP